MLQDDTSSALTKTQDCAKSACCKIMNISHYWQFCIFFSMNVFAWMDSCRAIRQIKKKSDVLSRSFYKPDRRMRVDAWLPRAFRCRDARSLHGKHGGKQPCLLQDVNRRASFQSSISAPWWQRSGERGRNGGRQRRREVWREERDERGKSQWRKSDKKRRGEGAVDGVRLSLVCCHGAGSVGAAQ